VRETFAGRWWMRGRPVEVAGGQGDLPQAAASSPAMIHMAIFMRHPDPLMTSTVKSKLVLVTSTFKSMRLGSLQS
jgi:hypothetical protein